MDMKVWIKPMVEKKIISDEEKRAIFSNIEVPHAFLSSSFFILSLSSMQMRL